MLAGGVVDLELTRVPLAVVDTETTGLYPGADRIIEIAIVRAESGAEPVVVLDTLVNPRRPVTATEIHGITDADVADAPGFEDIAPVVVDALCNAVFASYNVYFDAKFVREELRRVGVSRFPPHVCLMYLRPMLGLGRKCSLRDACEQSGVAHSRAHHASADALAAAGLWGRYLDACERAGVRTFRQLAGLRDYKFTNSFDDEMLGESSRFGQRTLAQLKSRSSMRPMAAVPAAKLERQLVVSAYWEALLAALADLEITPFEVFYLRAKQQSLGIRPDELRWLHARAFSGMLADMCQDRSITDKEASALAGLASALRELGWAPGD